MRKRFVRQRQKEFVHRVEDEIVRFIDGEVDVVRPLITYAKLSRISNFAQGKLTAEYDLVKKRTEAIKRRLEALLEPSPDVAYFLGTLIFGASAMPNKGCYAFRGKYSEVMFGHFGELCQKYFFRLPRVTKDGVFVCNNTVFDIIGNLDSNHWPEILLERYGWIFEDKDSALAFISAMFDYRGIFNTRKLTAQLSNKHGAELILEMLRLVGVKDAYITEFYYKKAARYRVQVGKQIEIADLLRQLQCRNPQRQEVVQSLSKV
ncbi:hypothetical protein A2690_01125 [Candidatus Roizmanbacteria bacterium RIFCSPHIGHO2_01_FULL_39_12b]|uniref:Homing endonuclease LAGLIDADG domain-containing protein n=1 Tax=Candidatus Roizmanbacteria bacterium RIFCSPHIGHO2_01_FULL_39_12b TaxID=1802030 RepID=A0A1F7GAS2_9BACT|nr:MAG: hypothetical protein A2690_01125 [Candidatus Roizmanbacteria bacterium RIFCSPHIGHO2_01_FULL_39_12b]OGM71667.1 MAG: hypothetical protein A3I55_00195 [Candidatus Woesebacteria bacterium RIFCSPLOWO2_02_FULL_42_10]